MVERIPPPPHFADSISTEEAFRLCSDCHEWESAAEFYANRWNGKKTRTGVYCKLCSCKRSAEWHTKNRERNNLRDARAEAIAANKVKCCSLCKKTKLYSDFSTNPTKKDGITSVCHVCNLWCVTKVRAKRKGIPFNITPNDVEAPELCPVLGITLSRGRGFNNDRSPSIDRQIPALGYVKGNIVVISWLANRIKSNCTDPTVLEKIAAYMRAGPNANQPVLVAT